MDFCQKKSASVGKILIEGGLYWKSHNVPLKIPCDFHELIKSYAIQKNRNEAKNRTIKNRACGRDSGLRRYGRYDFRHYISALCTILRRNSSYSAMNDNNDFVILFVFMVLFGYHRFFFWSFGIGPRAAPLGTNSSDQNNCTSDFETKP